MRVFGRVEFVGHDARQTRFARIVPLFEVSDGKRRAIEFGEFPSEHLVFWPSPKDAARGDLLFFTAESHPGTKDEYWAAATEPATEVLDLREYGSVDSVRKTIAMGTLGRGPARDRVALWCSDEELLGPLKLKDGATVISFDAAQLGRVPCHSVRKVAVHALPDDGGQVRHFLATSSLGAPTMYVDWGDDEAVVRRALKFVVERAREQGPDPAVTDRLIALSAKYAAAIGDTAELRLKQYQLARARELLLESQSVRALAGAFASELLAHPTVVKELADERASTRTAMQSELRSELAAETERVSAARSEHADLAARVASAGAELQASREALEKQVSDVETELSTRLHSILERPASVLAEVAVLRAGLSLNGASARHVVQAGPTPDVVAVQPRRSTIDWTRANRQLTELAQLRQALNASFKARGVSPSCAIALHCAFVAGLVPIVTGPCALGALEAYATAACGARRIVVHTSAALLEPSDLFGKVERGRFVPHAAGLIDAVTAATALNELALVILEGVNRGATESFLLPLVQTCASSGELSLFHPEAVTAPNSSAHARVRWPSNLRLAATAVEGPTSLPISRDLLAHCVVIEAESGEPGGERRDEPAEVSLASEIMKPFAPARDIVAGLLELPEATGARHALEKFSTALTRIHQSPERIRAELIERVLLPVAVTLQSESERERTLQAFLADLDVAEKDRLTELSRRLRRRLA